MFWCNHITMEIKYELTQRDFCEAIIAHQRRTRVSQWAHFLMLLMIAIFLGFGLFNFAVFPVSQWPSNGLPFFCIAFFWAYIGWIGPWQMAKKQFAKQPSAQGLKTVIFDATGTHWIWDGGESKLEWRHYTRVLDSKNHFLFYGSPVVSNVVPKRAFTAEQMADLRTLLTNHMPQGKNR
jgi:hypothetical protein